MTDHLISADELRQIADPAYDYVADADGYVRVPRRVWEQLRCDALAAADQLDLYALESARRAAA